MNLIRAAISKFFPQKSKRLSTTPDRTTRTYNGYQKAEHSIYIPEFSESEDDLKFQFELTKAANGRIWVAMDSITQSFWNLKRYYIPERAETVSESERFIIQKVLDQIHFYISDIEQKVCALYKIKSP
jgi:hypothetical protein